MKILVCIKRVPAPGAKINISDDEQSVNTANLGFTMSPHEECAVEEAVALVEQVTEAGGDATSTVLTLGPAEAEEQLRYSASIGIKSAVLLDNGGEDWDPQRTSAAIAAAIAELEAGDGPFDLILFGNESADSGGFQVGVRVAHKLGRPMVNGIKGIELNVEDGAGTVTARREVDAGFEVYSIPTPAVLGVKEGLNLPRYPTMKGRLASKKVEVGAIAPVAEAGGQTKVKLMRPEEKVSETVVLGTDESAAAAVVDLLDELGVL